MVYDISYLEEIFTQHIINFCKMGYNFYSKCSGGSMKIYLSNGKRILCIRADFILEHTDFYRNSTESEDQIFINSIKVMQNTLCENANSLVYAMIEDIDTFIEDAIEADGRGHFISMYDGEEIEQKVKEYEQLSHSYNVEQGYEAYTETKYRKFCN